MLKIVPDPPHHTPQTLEDILIQLSEYLLCAQTVSQTRCYFTPKPPSRCSAWRPCMR